MTFRGGFRIILAGLLIAAATTAYAQPSPKDTLLDKARSLEGRGRPDLAAQICVNRFCWSIPIRPKRWPHWRGTPIMSEICSKARCILNCYEK